VSERSVNANERRAHASEQPQIAARARHRRIARRSSLRPAAHRRSTKSAGCWLCSPTRAETLHVELLTQ
jgi:hypothetical protein